MFFQLSHVSASYSMIEVRSVNVVWFILDIEIRLFFIF